MLASVHGEDTPFTATAARLPGVARSPTSFSAALTQVENARVRAGIHLRFACLTAAGIGANAADYITRTQLLRVHRDEITRTAT